MGHVLSRRILVLAILIMAVSLGSVIVQQIVLDHATPSVQPPAGNAIAQARVSFCLNQPPTPDTGTCGGNATQNTTYTCQLNMSDADGTVTVQQLIVTAGDPIFNISASGAVNFTPTNDDVGNHSFLILTQDDSGCTNAEANVTFSLEVFNINDPPVLINDLPDVTLPVNTTVYPFFLTDYFVDPDGDAMNFTSTIPGDGITVTIANNSLVSFTTQSCDGDGNLIVFTATDPYNASTDSNIVTITIECDDDEDDQGGGDDGSGGGGGGGVPRCQPNFECQEWFACLPSNLQWQRCYDTKSCEIDRYLQRQCTYVGPPPACEENWLCEEWGACQLNGTQTRECTDLAGCDTQLVMPPVTQECVYLATCFDGVQNGDETGVDCGGSCGVCPAIAEPDAIVKRIGWFLLLLLLALLIAGAVGGYYRTAIARASAMLGFLLRHRVAKDVLLDAAERNSLFERIRAFETRPPVADPIERYDDLAELERSYLAEALALPLEATPDEVRERVKALGLGHETRALIEGILTKLAIIESEELIDDQLFFQASVEELRTAVCLTSEYTVSEIDRPLDEHPITDAMSFYDEIFARMIRILRAVQFQQLEVARSEYLELLSKYEPLTPAEQEQIYPELRWLFDVTRLASEAVGGRVIDKTAIAQA